MTALPPSDAAMPSQHGDVDEPIDTRDALMMAYVDDELPPAEREAFEALLASDATLAAETAAYQVMCDLAASSGALEPTERELRRFWAKFYNRAEWRTGWTLMFVGLAVLSLTGCYELIRLAGVPWIVRGAALSILLGAALLLGSTIRQRLRTRRFDRYRGVVR